MVKFLFATKALSGVWILFTLSREPLLGYSKFQSAKQNALLLLPLFLAHNHGEEAAVEEAIRV